MKNTITKLNQSAPFRQQMRRWLRSLKLGYCMNESAEEKEAGTPSVDLPDALKNVFNQKNAGGES